MWFCRVPYVLADQVKAIFRHNTPAEAVGSNDAL